MSIDANYLWSEESCVVPLEDIRIFSKTLEQYVPELIRRLHAPSDKSVLSEKILAEINALPLSEFARVIFYLGFPLPVSQARRSLYIQDDKIQLCLSSRLMLSNTKPCWSIDLPLDEEGLEKFKKIYKLWEKEGIKEVVMAITAGSLL